MVVGYHDIRGLSVLQLSCNCPNNMPIIQILLEKLADPLRISVLTGVLSSSYFFCGNLGASYWGIIPAIQDPTNDLSVVEKVKLWKFYYDRAKVTAFFTRTQP
jgi:hypothetical protein